MLLRPRLVEGVERGTLAIAPAAGGAARELAEDVEYADWSPTGELAVVRAVGGKRQLEFPLGTPIHESAGWLVNPRVSPRGDAVAVLESGLNVPQAVILVDRRGTVRPLASLAGRGEEPGWPGRQAETRCGPRPTTPCGPAGRGRRGGSSIRASTRCGSRTSRGRAR